MKTLLLTTLIFASSFEAEAAKPVDYSDLPPVFQVTVYRNGYLMGSNLPWRIKGNQYMSYQQSAHDLTDEQMHRYATGDCIKVLVTWPRYGYDPFWIYGWVGPTMIIDGWHRVNVPECSDD